MRDCIKLTWAVESITSVSIMTQTIIWSSSVYASGGIRTHMGNRIIAFINIWNIHQINVVSTPSHLHWSNTEWGNKLLSDSVKHTWAVESITSVSSITQAMIWTDSVHASGVVRTHMDTCIIAFLNVCKESTNSGHVPYKLYAEFRSHYSFSA